MGVNGIYGLSGSGLDIESMVKVGMLSKQNEYDKMAQKFTKNEWTKNALIDLYSDINTFNMSTLSQYKLSVNMNARTATSSNDTIKTTANASAAKMSHKVEVLQLASSAYLISSGKLAAEAEGDEDEGHYGSSKLEDILGSDEELSFELNDGKKTATIKLDTNGKTLTDLASAINKAGLNIKATYDVDNDTFSIYNNKSGSENIIGISDLDDNAKKLFNELKFLKSVDGELEGITREEEYEVTKEVPILDEDGNQTYYPGTEEPVTETITETLTRTVEGALTFGDGEEDPIIAGTNSKVKIDGVEYEKQENKFDVGGVTYDVTNSAVGETSRVTVAQDVDGIVDKVKSFIEDYNKLLASLYEKYDEKPESGYNPLTQSQKDSMKEEQVTKWEDKAKKGLLYHDKTLGSIINQMRTAVSTKVEGLDSNYDSIFSLGISTTGLKGQLVLDETKLRRALDEDPDSVYNVFGHLDKDDKASGNGIAQRLGDVFTSSLKTLRSRAGSSADIAEDSELNNLLRNLQTKMSNFKKMMDAFEDKLYKKYDTMEATLAKLGSQLNYITGGVAS